MLDLVDLCFVDHCEWGVEAAPVTIAENLGIGAIPPSGFAQSVACLKISWSHRSHTRRPIDVWKLVKFPSVSSAGPKDPTIGQIWIMRYKKLVTKVKVPEAPKFGSQQKQCAAIQRYSDTKYRYCMHHMAWRIGDEKHGLLIHFEGHLEIASETRPPEPTRSRRKSTGILGTINVKSMTYFRDS